MRQGDYCKTSFYFLKKLNLGKSKQSPAQFQYTSIALNLAYNKNKLYKIVDYLSTDMLDFNFSEMGLGLGSLPHSVYDFSKKMFFASRSIN